MVADCERQWFEDALREAEAGDIQMQVLVGQMYTSGYGVAKDVSKVPPLILIIWFVSECGGP
ncbi:hypothetical protein LINGRAHAP2_LOCUS15835 [Linum grandiflorum]